MQFQERRDSPRTQVDCEMTFRLAGQDVFHKGCCINISGSGVLFQAEMPVALGAAVEVHIVPPNAIIPPLTAFIEVVRCLPVNDGQFRIAGAVKGIKGN